MLLKTEQFLEDALKIKSRFNSLDISLDEFESALKELGSYQKKIPWSEHGSSKYLQAFSVYLFLQEKYERLVCATDETSEGFF